MAVAVKFSKGAMFKLKCLDFIVNHLFFIHSKHYPYVALLGADENGVIRGIAPLVKWLSTKTKGCYYEPKISVDKMTEATFKLVKQGLHPCGILRVGPDYVERLDTTAFRFRLNLFGVIESFLELFEKGMFNMVLTTNGLFIQKLQISGEEELNFYRPINRGWETVK